jgi:hypothetical protein
VPGVCNDVVPELISVRGTHLAACHRSDDLVDVTVDELRAEADEADLIVEDAVVEAT